jgi:hypothetical protein
MVGKMGNRPISLQSLPSICDVYVKQEAESTDGTKRGTVHSYILNIQSMPCSMQPLSGEEKIRVGIEYSKAAFKGYTNIDYDTLFDVGDIIKYRNKFWNIKEVLSYNEGPEVVQHVKYIVESLPVPPKGLI